MLEPGCWIYVDGRRGIVLEVLPRFVRAALQAEDLEWHIETVRVERARPDLADAATRALLATRFTTVDALGEVWPIFPVEPSEDDWPLALRLCRMSAGDVYVTADEAAEALDMAQKRTAP